MTILNKAVVCREATMPALEAAMAEILAADAKSVMVFACDASLWHTPDIGSWLAAQSVPLFGGIFPYLISERCLQTEGFVLLGLSVPVTIHALMDLNAPYTDWAASVAKWDAPMGPGDTLFTLVDGFANNVERYLEALYTSFGTEVKYVGCGAGLLSVQGRPCLITPRGVLSHTAMTVSIPSHCEIGFSHGWESFAGPFLVTSSEGNRIYTLNYLPAFQVYKNAIEAQTPYRFAEHSFVDIAKIYPFGISNVDAELLVRDPITVEGNALMCVGEVPVNSMVYLLRGTAKGLISAASIAATQAAQVPGQSGDFALVFDCISRQLFLEQDYQREIDIINNALKDNTALFGALSIGEICTTNAGPAELLNKSTVVAVF